MHDRAVTVRWLGAHAERVLAARGKAERLTAVLTESAVPMALLGDHRRIVDANEHHATAVGMSLDELRNLRIDDFTPPVLQPDLEQGWRRMLETDRPSEDDIPGPAPSPPLTPRELQVLALAANGLNGPAIAEALVLSQATVRTHFAHIYEKLTVGDRAGAVAKAMRLGLFT
jgi:ATP/maltotriose-dependent transcriptional regulator MalT